MSNYRYWQHFLALESGFSATGRYVEFSEQNFTTFSVEHMKLLLAICSEIDVLCKVVCHCMDSAARRMKRSNRSAIGVRLRAEVVGPDGSVRSVYRHVNSGGSFGANPLRQTIGLGKDGKVRLLEVFWPTSDETQKFQDVTPNQLIRITEGESDYSVQNVRKLSFH